MSDTVSVPVWVMPKGDYDYPNNLDEVEDEPTLFQRAEEIVNGKRQEDYGTPERNYDNIAKVWSGVIGNKLTEDITPQEVCMLLVAMKLVREANLHKDDNIVDAAGYLILTDRLR